MESGVFNYDLFTGLYISQYTNLDAKQLFEEKKQGSWQNILAAKNIPAPFQENIVYTNIMKGDEAEKVSEIIIHEMFQELFDITEDKQDLLIKQGFTTKEIAFICTLAHHVQIPTESITTLYLEKGQSWSEIANHYGLSPTDAGKVAEQLPEIK